jgi:methylenetetrahydrofolate--tRNA-(uracil-5-)-methyltransferase
MKEINIIGAGLAGSEAAYYLLKQGFKVNLYEVKRVKKNPVQKLDTFGELVCSNTLRSTLIENAAGCLKEEMATFDSLVIKAAKAAQIPAGASLAVDREQFSGYITDVLRSFANLTIIDQEMTTIDPNVPTIIATGPLTTDGLQEAIAQLIGKDYFYFFDAVAPIVTKDSINFEIVYRKNRYDKGETQDYLNAPMTEEEYNKFWTELVNAESADAHLDGERADKFFEGCMPVEVMAKRGKETLTFGPLKPVGLRLPDGTTPHAVVQLRQDNAADEFYNLVGFQTNLKWGEQKRVFSLIPGLENAEFVRYGVMHKNNYINSPAILSQTLQLKSNPNIFFAGQITGVEGYVESAASGIIAGINAARMLNEQEPIIFPNTTVMGGLIHYITHADPTNFQPMKSAWGIVAPLEQKVKKTERKLEYTKRALNDIKVVCKKLN